MIYKLNYIKTEQYCGRCYIVNVILQAFSVQKSFIRYNLWCYKKSKNTRVNSIKIMNITFLMIGIPLCKIDMLIILQYIVPAKQTRWSRQGIKGLNKKHMIRIV